MAEKEVAIQQKKELSQNDERAEAGKFYSPHTDVFESAEAVTVVMEIPGVERSAVDVQLDKDVLTVTGNVDFGNYEALEPIYSEYNIGNFSRRFTLSTKIDSERISAKMTDGVLTLHLPKASEAVARRIEIA